jgi:hypothetical protein
VNFQSALIPAYRLSGLFSARLPGAGARTAITIDPYFPPIADGTFSGSQLMAGTLEVAHTYARPGEYRLKAWLTPTGSTIRMADAAVRIAE